MPTIEGPGWKLSGISGLIFDKDGTIIDSHLYWGEIVQRRAVAVAKYYGINSALHGRICSFMGYDIGTKRLLTEGPVALVHRKEVISVLIDKLESIGITSAYGDLENIFGGVMRDFNKDILSYISLLPGVESLIIGAKDFGFKLALVTSDSVLSTEKILRYTGLDKYFDSVVGRETTDESKNTGVPALRALSDLGLPNEKVVAIGDAPVDAEMSLNSGLKATILVSSGQIPRVQLKESSSFVADSLLEIRVI